MAGDWGFRPSPQAKLSRKAATNTFRNSWGIRPNHETSLKRMRSNAETIVTLRSWRALNPHPSHSVQWEPSKNQEVQRVRRPMSCWYGGMMYKKRCVPTPRRMGARPIAVGTWRTNYTMAIGIQRMGIRPMAVGIQCLSDNSEIKTTHLYYWKMTKKQWSGIKPIAADTQRANFNLRAEANYSYSYS